MQWERPVNDGLAWTTTCAASAAAGACGSRERARHHNHAVSATTSASRWRVIEPVAGGDRRAHRSPRAAAVRRTAGLRARDGADPALQREVFFERFGYDSPHYGCICPHSLFRTSQHTHAGSCSPPTTTKVLALLRRSAGTQALVRCERPYAQTTDSSRRIFGLAEGETHWTVDFDDPRSGHSLANGAPASSRWCARGREPPARQRDCSARCLGYSQYTGAPATSTACEAGARRRATQVTDVLPDEFGHPRLLLHRPRRATPGPSWRAWLHDLSCGALLTMRPELRHSSRQPRRLHRPPDGSLDWLDERAGADTGGRGLRLSRVHGVDRRAGDGAAHLRAGAGLRSLAVREHPVFVMSHAPSRFRSPCRNPCIPSSRRRDAGRTARPRPICHLYVDGGQTIQGFLRAGLLDDITVTVIPVLLGAGRPLFGPLGRRRRTDADAVTPL